MKKLIILFLILITLTVQGADERYIAGYDTRTFPTPSDTTSTSTITTITSTGGSGFVSIPWADVNVADNITINWVGLDTYPTACSAGEYVSAVGDTLTCSAPTTSSTVLSIPWADANVADNITVAWAGITGVPYIPTEQDIDWNAIAWDTNFTTVADFNNMYASLFGATFTGDTNFSNIGFSGYIYGDGSKLTNMSTTTYPDSVAISAGTTDLTLDINAMKFYDGNAYTFAEGSGTNPLDVNIYFSGVDTINQILIREYYAGSSSHHIQIQLWAYDTNSWETYSNIVGQSGYNTSTLGVYDTGHHVESGNAILRFHHLENGIASHRLYIDYAWLLKGDTVGSTVDLNGFAKYGFASNNFSGTGNFVTTGDINASDIGFSGFIFGDGSKLTNIILSGWQPDSTLDLNTTANTSWLGKAHTFTAIQTIQADLNITQTGTDNGISFEPDLNRIWLGEMFLDYNGTAITIGG